MEPTITLLRQHLEQVPQITILEEHKNSITAEVYKDNEQFKLRFTLKGFKVHTEILHRQKTTIH